MSELIGANSQVRVQPATPDSVWAQRVGAAATEITVPTAWGELTLGGAGEVIPPVFSTSGVNSGPAVLNLTLNSDFFGNDSPETLVDSNQANLFNYALTSMRSPDFNISDPNNYIWNSNHAVISPPTAQERQAVAFLNTPNAPEVRQAQQSIDQVLQQRTGMAPDALLQNPQAIQQLTPTQLEQALATLVQGEGIPTASINGQLLYELQQAEGGIRPQTDANQAMITQVGDQAVVFRRSQTQQALQTALIQEFNRRTETTANQIISDGRAAGLDQVALPYTNEELIQMGLVPGTPTGDAGRMILASYVQQSGSPESLRQTLRPENTRFSFTYNTTADSRGDFLATGSLAGINSVNSTEGAPVPIDTLDAPMADYLPPGSLVNGQQVENFARVSFNLPMLQDEAQYAGTSLLQTGGSAVANEMGNQFYNNVMFERVGFNQPVSVWSSTYHGVQQQSGGNFSELFSDMFQTYQMGMTPEQRTALNELAERDPQAATEQFRQYMDLQINGTGDTLWNQLRATGLSTSEFLAYRYGASYKDVNGGQPIYNPEQLAEIRANFEQSVSQMGFNPAMTQAFSDYAFNQLHGDWVGVSARMTERGFTDERHQRLSELYYLTNHDIR
ncbi:MAG: hypothetical protein SFZ03_11875 [Candidatus Melainabacteria bacterium]|nr:hypothetical protein [Candidatus Melainabacteria bacterium]